MDNGPTSKDCSRLQNSVASHLRSVPQDGSDFPQMRGIFTFPVMKNYFLSVKAQIGENCSGAQMASISQDRITNVIKVSDFRPIEGEHVLDLAAIADNTVLTYDAISTDEGSGADFRMSPNVSWA
jgi:hypothetical protein